MKQVQAISQVVSDAKKILKNENQMLPAELQNASPLEEAIKKQYPAATDLLNAATPECQTKWVKYPTQAFWAKSPTLNSLDRLYGETTSGSWIMAEITNLVEYCDCKDSMTADQIESVSDLIAARYKHYKISEFLLFFGLMKLGKYGDFYGRLIPIRITNALKTFNDEREAYLIKIDNKSII